jgi:oxygen-independent coproporphyrinogen-3 oxidase
MRGLYVHLPFCRSKCAYCGFASLAGRGDLIDGYIQALLKEAAGHAGLAGSFSTLYIGGGTPSLLSETQLERLFSGLARLTGPFSALGESTFEANPESMTPPKAALLKTAGISRVSMGLQAVQDTLLKKLGRLAMKADFLRAWKDLREAGFSNLSADLMCGLPGQSLKDFTASLAWLLDLKPEHVSLYALEVHEGTPFHAAGVRDEPDAAADMYEAARAALKPAGLARYEISNFARPGRRSLHNLNYWQQGEYLGLGAAAASCLDGTRRANTEDTQAYMAAAGAGLPVPLQYSEKLIGRALRAEKIMLGLRITDGIELSDDIFIEFDKEIGRLLTAGLVERFGRTLKIKEDRFYVSNAVFREFV